MINSEYSDPNIHATGTNHQSSDRDYKNIQYQINNTTENDADAMYLSNKTASNNNAKRKELRQELQGKNGVILKKDNLTGSGFAISGVSGSSEDSQFTESDGLSMVIGGKRIYSKETVLS